MRILIVGAGGVGGFYGAWLLNAGRDVTFLVRPARAAQLQRDGLTLEHPGGILTLPPPQTVTAAELNTPYDLIILSCKAFDLVSAMNDFAPAVGPESAIIPLLNGMAHMDALDARFGREHVLGGDTTVSSVREPDGRILHLNTLDDLHFGDRDHPLSERMQRINQALSVPGITAHLVEDIQQAMWDKWIAISTAACVTCLMRATIGDIMGAGAGHLVHQALAETSSIAIAEGFPPSHEALEVNRKKFTKPDSPFTTSMSRDIDAGNPIENFQIIGDLVLHARRKNVPIPLLEIVNAHLNCYEFRRKRESATKQVT